MIVIRVELHSAVTGKVQEIATAVVANVGGTAKRGDYDVRVGRKTDAGNVRGVYLNPLRTGSVHDYPRLSYNVWRLVIRALLSAFPEEQK